MSEPKPAKLYTALLAAQRDYGPVVKNATNPHLKNKYADLGAILDAVTEPLAKHGILLLQRFTPHEGVPMLLTELVHAESGESISSVLPVVSKDSLDPQKVGSAITYYRRYSLLALLGLRAEDDDDGNAASKPAASAKSRNGVDLQPQTVPLAQPQRPAPASTGTPATNDAPRLNDIEQASNGTPAPQTIDVDAINPHPEGSVEHLLFEARRLAQAGETVPEVWRFLTSRQRALGDDWKEVVREWNHTLKPMIAAAAPAAPPLSHAG